MIRNMPVEGELQYDRAAEFERLFASTRRKAFNLAYGLLRQTSDAEDVTQAAFTRAWQHFDQYDRRRPFENWLYRIITNLAYDCLRHRKTARSVSLDVIQERVHGAEPIELQSTGAAGNPETVVLSGELSERMRDALDSLGPDYQQAVMLAFVEGLSYEAISTATNLPVGTVRSRIHRGRKRMRLRLAA